MKKTLIYLLIGVTVLSLIGCSKIKEEMMPQCNDTKVKSFIEESLNKGSTITIKNIPLLRLSFNSISGYRELSYDKEQLIRTCEVGANTQDGVALKIIYTIKPADSFGKYKIQIENIKYKDFTIKAN